jgi:hypothetical protein
MRKIVAVLVLLLAFPACAQSSNPLRQAMSDGVKSMAWKIKSEACRSAAATRAVVDGDPRPDVRRAHARRRHCEDVRAARRRLENAGAELPGEGPSGS